MHACLGGCTGDNPATNASLGYAARGAEGAHIALEDTYPLAFIAHYCGSGMATYRVGTGCAGAAGGMSEPGSAPGDAHLPAQLPLHLHGQQPQGLSQQQGDLAGRVRPVPRGLQ